MPYSCPAKKIKDKDKKTDFNWNYTLRIILSKKGLLDLNESWFGKNEANFQH